MGRLIFNILGTASVIRVVAQIIFGKENLVEFFGGVIPAAVVCNGVALIAAGAFYIPHYLKNRADQS